MSSKSNKRSNEDAESEPAAKRKAVADPEKEEKTAEVSSNHLESISSAQEAFDRLDFKSAQQICARIIDADPDNASALVLRSITRERTGQLQESVDDAEAAVKVKGEKNRKTYVRGAFAHLGRAKHLLQLALLEIEDEDGSQNQKDVLDSTKNDSAYQPNRKEVQEEAHSQEDVIMKNGTEPEKEIQQEEETQESWLQELNLEELIGGITTMQVKEVRGPFRRINSELLVHIVYFFDSPTIVRVMGVSKSLKSLIIRSPNLFRQFEMEGEMDQIIKGIDSFRSRCKDSIQAIDLKVKGIPTNKEIRRFRESIKPSSQSLRDIWIGGNPNLCQLMLEIAAEAPLLSILSSYKEKMAKPSLIPASTLPKMPAAWKPRLRTFNWISGESLEVGPVLLSALQGAQDVRIASRGVQASWVLDLLSSAPSLRTLWIFYMSPDTEEVIPLMNLPTLSSLSLAYAPKSTSTHDSSVFFQNLKAPNLFYLMLKQSNLKELASLSPDSSPANLSISGLEDSCSDAEAGEAAASALVSSISKWDKLTRLSLKLDSSSAAFWNRLIWLITPMSRENVQAGYRDRLLLPRLRYMVLGRQNSKCEAAIPGTVLASLIASRKSLNRGLCSNDVLFAAMGDLQASSSAPPASREDTLFKDSPKCAQIQDVEVNVPIVLDGAIESWLKEAVTFKCSTPLGM